MIYGQIIWIIRYLAETSVELMLELSIGTESFEQCSGVVWKFCFVPDGIRAKVASAISLTLQRVPLVIRCLASGRVPS